LERFIHLRDVDGEDPTNEVLVGNHINLTEVPEVVFTYEVLRSLI
jgi:hypothetical protein